DRRAAAPRDGVRHGARVVQRRGVRDRADADADRRRGRRARGRAPAHHALRRRACSPARLRGSIPLVGWTMLYLFVALKLPILAACYIIWWAVHQEPDY